MNNLPFSPLLLTHTHACLLLRSLWKYAICPRTVAPLCAPGGFAPTFPPPLPPWPWPMRLLRPLLLLLLLLPPPVPLLQPRQVRARLRGRKRLQRCTGGTHGARQSLQHAPWQPCLQSRTFPQKSPIPPSPLPFICMLPLFPTTWKLSIQYYERPLPRIAALRLRLGELVPRGGCSH